MNSWLVERAECETGIVEKRVEEMKGRQKERCGLKTNEEDTINLKTAFISEAQEGLSAVCTTLSNPWGWILLQFTT